MDRKQELEIEARIRRVVEASGVSKDAIDEYIDAMDSYLEYAAYATMSDEEILADLRLFEENLE